MEERGTGQIYKELKQEFSEESQHEVENLKDSMELAINAMFEAVQTYEQKRAENLDNFKEQLNSLLEQYYSEVFLEQLKSLNQLKQENAQKFHELDPQMEAISQIRNIYHQSFMRQGWRTWSCSH